MGGRREEADAGEIVGVDSGVVFGVTRLTGSWLVIGG